MLKKPCSKCGVWKSPKGYHERKGRYMCICKQCHAKYANEYYHEKVKARRQDESQNQEA